MSDVIHATERALKVLRQRVEDLMLAPHLGVSTGFACGAQSREGDAFTGHCCDSDASAVNRGEAPMMWPTCMACLVLLDDALERPVRP